MNIRFSPQIQLDAKVPTMSVSGDVLTVDGENFDFTGVLDGYRLPADAISGPLVVEAYRENGVLVVTVTLPCLPEEDRQSALYPVELEIAGGPVPVPTSEGVI